VFSSWRITKMSGCDSRKRKRELNKEEIRECMEVFGEIINKRYNSNKMPLFDNNSLTFIIHPKKRNNNHQTWYQIFPDKGRTLTVNKVISFNSKMVS
jgi:hypothetical protein